MTSSHWPKGRSGNPSGRKPGTGAIGKLRASIVSEVPEILTALIGAAKTGDVQAARLLLERVLPPLKAAEEPVALELSGESVADQGRAVIAAAACGTLTTTQASSLLTSLATLSKIVETDELLRRIEALETKHGVKPKEKV